MRTTLQNWTLLFGSAVLLAFPVAASAQLSTYDIETRIGAESHVGNVTGHAKDAALPYRGTVSAAMARSRWQRRKRRLVSDAHVPKATRLPVGRLQVPLHSHRTLPTDQDLFDAITRGFDRSNMPQWNTLSKQERVPTWWLGLSTTLRAGRMKKPGAPIQIPPERKSPPSASSRA